MEKLLSGDVSAGHTLYFGTLLMWRTLFRQGRVYVLPFKGLCKGLFPEVR